MEFLPLPHEHSNHAIAVSQNALIVVVFANSKSQNLSAALHIAAQAQRHDVLEIDTATFNLVAFSRDANHASLAITLLNLVSGWKGTHVFVGGRSSHDVSKIIRVLDCYQMALRCNDHTAHCHVTFADHSNQQHYQQEGFFSSIFGNTRGHRIPQETRTMHPCRYVAQHHDAKLDKHHTATMEDQLQAHAIRHECEWCPYLDISKLRRIEVNYNG